MLKRAKNILCWVVSVLFCDLRKVISPTFWHSALCAPMSSGYLVRYFSHTACKALMITSNTGIALSAVSRACCEVMRGETACTAPPITFLQSGPLFVPHSMPRSCVASASLIVHETSASGHTNIFR
ncbi:hypothetical protein EDB89DRAFT_1997331 [Lactarius sanguifluus]|nr:hypothetical protein EDB89DRAFT_1997331 [Lactarius sanguifluus]